MVLHNGINHIHNTIARENIYVQATCNLTSFEMPSTKSSASWVGCLRLRSFCIRMWLNKSGEGNSRSHKNLLNAWMLHSTPQKTFCYYFYLFMMAFYPPNIWKFAISSKNFYAPRKWIPSTHTYYASAI